ncbi:hypothetical protein CNMCM8927_003583 [Aspergillus lentulus]|uniref:Dynamin GTPase n=1 Tax=Aspergillus lentulus TaxID=293939 RepID=A0AAN5YTX0_ASPLE|nr:hypothetical protein CNMCM8927_003583 [Aspergillus lentulus]
MGRFTKVLMPWRHGAKSKSREKRVTQKDIPKKIPAVGAIQKCSQNFQMDLPPGTLQSDVDQRIFNPDWTLRPGWRVVIEGVQTSRGWEYVFIHRKTGGSYEDVDMTRRRDYWAQITEEKRQKALASRSAPSLGSGGVSEDVSLPQLVVVGDQSSGKSSVLEALTGLSFPIASDLCTRHATQIELRRASAEDAAVKITIIPGPTARMNDEVKERLLNFERRLPVEQFGPAEFTRIFDEAAQCMGVPGPNTESLENLEKRFSDDILRIELSGPEQRHLSVVDVPGLFHNPTRYQTAEDRVIIRKLIEGYITDKRTIILAVMDARNNLANQEVFSMARAADPQGARTVGIITKCDALEPGDEDGVLRIAKNEVERLKHGWYVVKNRSTMEIRDGVTIEERHARERVFFGTTAPWTDLPRDHVGIENVKRFLAGLLYRHIQLEFPSLVKEIEDLTRETQNQLEMLGPSRQTSIDQRRVLLHIALSYQDDVNQALRGIYRPEIEAHEELRLRLRIRELNEEFAERMNRNGHARVFRTVKDEVDQEFSRDSDGEENIYDWIRKLYRDSRGVELPGTVNPAVLENMFRQQSAPWNQLALEYYNSVRAAITAFNDGVFGLTVTDDDLRRNLRARLQQPETAAFRTAEEYLSQLLRDEREGILQTVNNYFAENIASIREKRMRARLGALGIQDDPQFVDIKQLMGGIHLSNDDQAIYDSHDTLKAFYKVALKRFTDNVIVQVTERYLLGPRGPVKLLSPELIGELSDGELADIASENFATSSTRNEVQTRMDKLRRALEIARQAAQARGIACSPDPGKNDFTGTIKDYPINYKRDSMSEPSSVSALIWAENIALLSLLHSVPNSTPVQAVPTPPSKNPLPVYPQSCLTSYPLSFEREKVLVATFAFLAQTEDDPNHIPAVCVEQDTSSASLNIILAINKTKKADGSVILNDLKRGFEDIFAILRMSENSEEPSNIERKVFAAIVSMCSTRILQRLRFLPSKRKPKKSFKAILQEAIEFVRGIDSRRLTETNLSSVANLFVTRSRDMVRLTDSWSQHQTATRLMDLVEGINQLRQIEHVNALLGLIPNRMLDPSAKSTVMNIIGKVSRYREAARLLCRTSRKLAIARKMRIVLVDLPQAAFPALPARAFSRDLSCTLSRIDRAYGKPESLRRIFTLLKTTEQEATARFMAQRQRILEEGKIHAEVQLIAYCELQMPRLPPRVICSSKKACLLCNLFILTYGKIYTPGSHGRLYPGWRLPVLPSLNTARKSFNEALEAHIRQSLSTLFSRQQQTTYPCPNESTLLTLPVSVSTNMATSQCQLDGAEVQPPSHGSEEGIRLLPLTRAEASMTSEQQTIELKTSVLTAHKTAVAETDSHQTLTGSGRARSETMSIKDCDTRNLSQGLPSYGTVSSNRASPFYVAGCLEVQVEVPTGLQGLAYSIEWLTDDEATVVRQGQHSIPLIDAQALTTEISLHDHNCFLITAKGVIARVKLFRYSS